MGIGERGDANWVLDTRTCPRLVTCRGGGDGGVGGRGIEAYAYVEVWVSKWVVWCHGPEVWAADVSLVN